MSEELQLWVRLTQSIVGLVLAVMALTYCVALWLEDRRLYLSFAVAAFLAMVPLLLLRIATVPEPPLLPKDFIDVASLVLNAIWPLFGLAWLAALLRDRLRANRLRRKLRMDADTEGSGE